MSDGSPPPLGIGLVGVGRHGSRYLQHLLGDLPGAALAALCRRTAGERLPGCEVPLYGDYRAMIADPKVEAVVVVTPPTLCRDICLAATSAGKPILIEKPLATSGADARAMVAAADRARVPLMTAQTLRFDPAILLLKEQLRTIGRLQSATLVSHIETKANMLPGTATPVPLGALLELGVHLLDLVRFLTGEEIAEVRCSIAPAGGPETVATVRLRTTGGLACTLDIARVESQRVGTAEWIGSAGTVTADWPGRTVTRCLTGGASDRRTVEPRPTVLAALQAFVHAIRTGTPPPVTGLDGCRAVEAADACYRSASLGGAAVSPADAG